MDGLTMSPSRPSCFVLGLLWASFYASPVHAAPAPTGPTAQALGQVLLTGFQRSGRWAADQGSIQPAALSCIESLSPERFARIVQGQLDKALPASERQQLDRWFAPPARAQLMNDLISSAMNPNATHDVSVTNISPQDQQDLTLLKSQGTLDKMLRALMDDPAGKDALVAEAEFQISRCKQP
jgi:hypothetical protein